MVEFALILPVFLIILLGMLEFGIVFDHRNAMSYAVREGARVGASLGNGGSQPAGVDPAILAAVQRGLTDPILIENIRSIDLPGGHVGPADLGQDRHVRPVRQPDR
jgi:hypothetical protein